MHFAAARPTVGKLWHAFAQAGRAPTTASTAQQGGRQLFSVSQSNNSTVLQSALLKGDDHHHHADHADAVRLRILQARARFAAANATTAPLQGTGFNRAPGSSSVLDAAREAAAAARTSVVTAGAPGLWTPTSASSSADLAVPSLEPHHQDLVAATASPADASTVALLRLLAREHATLLADASASGTDPVADVVAKLHQLLAASSPASPEQRRALVLAVLADAARNLLADPAAAARLHLVAQRLLARMGDLDALREWKKLANPKANANAMIEASPPASPVPQVLEPVVQQQQTIEFAAPAPAAEADAIHEASQAQAERDRKPYLEFKSNELLSLARGRQLAPAMQVFSALTAKSLTPLGDATHAYLELLAGHHRLDSADAAFRTLHAIEAASAASPSKLARHQYFLYNSYLSACCTAGHGDRALTLYAEMKHALGQLPDLRTITRLFSVLAKRPTDARALAAMCDVLGDLRAAGIAPYPLLFNLALSQAVAQRQRATADSLFAQMQAAGVVPTAVTFSTLIKGDLAAGDTGRAMARFDLLCAHPHAQRWAPHAVRAQFANSIGPFNALIQHHVHTTRDAEKAHGVFAALERQFVPVVAPTGFTLHLLVAACMLERDSKVAVRQATDLIRRMQAQYHLRPNASHFLPILETLAHRGEWGLARNEVVDRAMRREFRVEARGEAIEALVAQVVARTST
ncbi:hypothetical protein H9P43_009638 [Blastocladiella emersonii ATCC 22665]|nr:hypothetical protein H9P43_009638 [Blastocladiella emersonii ATCC 22665]